MTMTRRAFTLASLAVPAVAFAEGSAFGAAAARDPLWFVHPQLRPAAAGMKTMMAAFPPFSVAGLPMARQAMSRFAQRPLSTPRFEKRSIPGARGMPDVTVYVVNARPGPPRPGILHMHGGGFIIGSAAADIRMLQETAQALDATIVSVDYRLAPETRWAGSIEDNYAGLRWLHSNAAALGVDPARIAVMGESAGGGHAALLAITAHDRGEVPVAFQCLTYPMLDDRTGSSRPAAPNAGAIGWTAEANRFGWSNFLGMPAGGRDVPAGAVPARRETLDGLPPAWIGVGSIDLFLAEDMVYAERLIAAGVMTEVAVVPGAFHGFEGIAADTPIARDFRAARLNALRTALTT